MSEDILLGIDRPVLDDETLGLFYTNMTAFCYGMMPETFYAPPHELSNEIDRAIDDRSHKKTMILSPRGIGKTSKVGAYIIRNILFREYTFVVYISKSSDLAVMQTENIRRELMGNELIRTQFGSITTSDKDVEIEGLEAEAGKKMWVAFGKVLVLPRGAGQQVRGLVWKCGGRSVRPNLFIIDDLEDKDEIQNENTRKKIRGWFMSDLMKCVSKYDHFWRMFYIDTLKHQDALPVHIQAMGDWNCIVQSAFNDNLESTCPGYMTTEELKTEYQKHQAIGELDTFFREYGNKPIAPDTAGFRAEYFRDYDEATIPMEVKRRWETVVIMDPAKSVTQHSDFSAIVVVSVDWQMGCFYVREVFNARVYPDELYKKAVELYYQYKATGLGYEVTSLNEFIIQPFKDYITRNGHYMVELVELKARGKKEDRIRALVPYYRQRIIFHSGNNTKVLESQLMSFPVAQFDDASDALAYMLSMFNLGERLLLMPPPENDKADKLPPPELPAEDEYADLEYEPALEGGWEII
jgi:hypothetical protein